MESEIEDSSKSKRKNYRYKQSMCSYCNKEYNNLEKYYDHLNTHQKLFYYQCHLSDCYKLFETEGSLRSHLYKMHNFKFKENN